MLLDQPFRALFEAAADAMIVVDGNDRVVLMNHQAEAVFGYTASEMIGRSFQILIPARFREDHRLYSRGFFHGAESRRLMSTRSELMAVRKGGDEFPVEITISKFAGSDRVLVAAIVRDITERHLAEQALLKREAELERMVRSKDELVASVSHEIRTPLSSIVGFARILHEDADLSETERGEMLALLVQLSGDLTNIVEDLLIAAKADLGKLELSKVSVDLRAQAAQIVEWWDSSTRPAPPPADMTVRCVGDPARVRQIVRNLVANALKYGGREVRIRVGTRPGVGLLLVADNGPGIPEEHRERIFGAYERGDDVAGLTPSLGLGLYISRSLARLMGGDLSYRYENGESIFELALPLAETV